MTTNYAPSLKVRAAAELELRRRAALVASSIGWRQIARPKQLPPEGDWQIWLILAGRGFGKTRTIAEWAIEQARTQPGSRGAIIAATAADVRDVLMEGDSGIMTVSLPDFMPTYEPSKRRVTWPNGSQAITFSADEPKRLRGPQQHWAICDELAAWRYPDTFDQLLFGTRLGKDPRIAIATTPRPTPLIIRLTKDPTCVVVSGSTYENEANLAPTFISKIIQRYEGTTLGQQELYAVLLMDNPRALWKRENIEQARVMEAADLKRIVVAIDPAVSDNEGSSETGIIVAGIGRDGHGYILEDATVSGSPDTWAKAAITAYHKYKADRIIAEVNNGGDMIEYTLRTIENSIPITQVRASRNKQTRAEPVAALYEQLKVHHVGMFAALEDQQCQWIPGDKSPDRLDAAVWALTELMLDQPGETKISANPFFD